MTAKQRKSRNEQGMSLAAVMSVGVVVMLMVSAMFATILPLFRSVTSMNSDYKLRTTTEMGVDYALAQVNSGAAGWDIATTPGSASNLGSHTAWKNIPQTALGQGNQSGAAVDVQMVGIGNPPGPPGTTTQYNGVSGVGTSMLFDINLENDTNPTHLNQGAYRMIVARSTVPGTGTQRFVRAILQPVYNAGGNNQGNPNNNPGGNNPGAGGRPQYGYPLFGIASIVYAGQAGLNTYNFAAGSWVGGGATGSPSAKQLGYMQQAAADGGSLGKISQVYGGGGLTRSIAQGGAHYEFPNPLSTYNQQFSIAGQNYNAAPAVTAPWMNMYGNVYSNGRNTAYFPLLGASDPNNGTAYSATNNGVTQTRPAGVAANVFGVTNGIDASVWNPLATSPTAANAKVTAAADWGSRNWTGGIQGFNQVGANGGYTYPQPTMPPPVSAPPGTPNVGPVKVTNGATLRINGSMPATSVPTSIGTLSGSGTVVDIPVGSYVMSSLTVTAGGKIVMDAAAQSAIASGAKSDVNFYLQGNAPPSVAMTVDNTSSVNMTGITGTGFNFSGKTMIPGNAAQSNQIAINNPADSSVASTTINETSGGAQQLNIYSNYGSGTAFNLSGNERCIINAPYANVNIGSLLSNKSPMSLANDANFYGAAYASNIAVQSAYSSGKGAFVHYDYRLHPPGANNPWVPWSPMISNNGANNNNPGGNNPGGNAGAVPPCVGYRAVSWQEAVRSSVGAQQPLAPGLNEMLPSDMRWSYNF